MYCKKCGKKLEVGDRFCSNCGTPVTAAEADSAFGSVADMGRGEEPPARKPFHMDDLQWDLEGFPEEDSPETDDIDFNWSSVLEERDNHIYRGFEEPSGADGGSGIFGDMPETKSGAFDWSLGSTMRIDRPSDVVKRKREEALKAREAEETGAKNVDESAAESSETGGPGNAPLPEEPKEAEKKSKADTGAEEGDRPLKLEDLTESSSAGTSHKIDKFYTFNKKNEEFQALLDQEYERLRQRIREESDAEASFKEKYEKLQKARDDWSREELRSAAAEEKKTAGAGAAIGGVMAAVDRFKNRPSKADDEVDGLDDYVITDLFEGEAGEKKEETVPAPEEKPAEAETEAAEPVKAEADPVEAKAEPAEGEKTEAETEPSETPESEPAEQEKADAEPAEERKEAEPSEEAEAANEAEAEPEKEPEADENNAGEAGEKPAKEPETCPPSDEKKDEPTGEKDGSGEEACKSKVADTALFDDGDEPDEEDAKKHKKGRALNIVIGILAVIVVINLVMVGILMFAEDSTAAKCINDGYSKIISFFTGDSEEPADEPEPASEETELTGTAALVEAEKDRARSIGTVEAAADLTIPSGMEERISGLDGSETFVDMAWYTDDEGATVNYGNAVVGQVLEYYSGLVDSKNEESGEESVTYGINTLRIGEIRQNGVDFYVMVETEEVTSDSSDVTKGEYVVHLVAEDKKVTVSEVVDVLEEN